MNLFTKTEYELMLKNGADTNFAKDYPPVVGLYMTNTNFMWLISELDPEYKDIAFGLCDLGVGIPELGSVCISELLETEDLRKLHFIEREPFFEPKFPLSVYAAAAREHRKIITNPEIVAQFQPH